MEEEVIIESKSKEIKKKKKNKGSEKKSKSEKTTKKSSKKSKSKSVYDQPNEYNPRKIYNAFTTQRKPCTNNMKFLPITLKSPENNLITYRDTFRSCVNVSVVYLQVSCVLFLF